MTLFRALTSLPPRPRSHRRPAATRAALASLAVLLLAGGAACSADRIVGSGNLPSNVVDPNQMKTPTGALSAYYAAVTLTRDAWGGSGSGINPSFIVTSGEFADELKSGYYGMAVGAAGPFADMAVDSRNLPEASSASTDVATAASRAFSSMAKARGQISEARGLLATYAPAQPPALRGALMALEGYLEVMWAEMYCSGIPLTTLDFNGDYTLTRGFSTDEVLTHAVAQFDSAITLAGDSTRVVQLARVGKGRALLNLGQYADAAQAVHGVPDGFAYRFLFDSVSKAQSISLLFSTQVITVADTEGGASVGMNFVSAGDPRVVTQTNGTNTFVLGGPTLYRTKLPTKAGADSLVFAGAVEARLIEAEAALQANDASWLTILNAIRTSCTTTVGCPTPAPAGSGGVAGLPPLTDPGSDSARISLLFRERAFWLFLTGHRQGDLRRLVRQYHRDQSAVYPSGVYLGASGSYGSDVNAPVPAAERANSLFHGCIDRGA